MKRVAILVTFAACHDELVQPWQLDHDRIVAARATPAGIASGEAAQLDALIAHEGGVTDVEMPTGATAAGAPGGLFTAVHFMFDHWEIQAPDDAQLAAARAELGLAATAPVPLEVTLVFPGKLVASKLVWLGESRANPALPAITIDGVAPGTTLDLPRGRDITLSATGDDVSWLSSTGTLHDDDANVATLDVARGDPATGELAVVVRDGAGGIVWQVWSITTH